MVVVVVVVTVGDEAACAGTITDLTTGLTHLSGTFSAPNVPPAKVMRKMRRRSTVMVCPKSTVPATALRGTDAHFVIHRNSDWRSSCPHTIMS